MFFKLLTLKNINITKNNGVLKMPSTIEDLKTALGQLARPSKYKLFFTLPVVVQKDFNESNIDLFCLTTEFPGKTIGQIELWNQGRKLIIPGDTTFANTWNVTFYNNEEHSIRVMFASWMKACDNFQENIHTGVPSNVMTNMRVAQLDSAGAETAIYTFHNVFPQDMAAVSIGDDQQDAVEQFDVTFSFTDWVVGTEAQDGADKFTAMATKNPTAYSI